MPKRKIRALLMFFAGVIIALLGALMALMGMHHVFSARGGAIYYGSAIVILMPAGILICSVAWGTLADDDPPRV